MILEALPSDDADKIEGLHTQSQSPEKQYVNESIDIVDIKTKGKKAVEEIDDNKADESDDQTESQGARTDAGIFVWKTVRI